MDNLEARVAQLESDLRVYARQNRRMRLLFLPCVLLAGLPFLLAWKNGGTGVFETVKAESFIVEKNGSQLAVLSGGSHSISPVRLRGFLKLYAPEGPIVELGGTDSSDNGNLQLSGIPKAQRNRSQIVLGVNTFGAPSLVFTGQKVEGGLSTASVGVGSEGNPTINFSSPKTGVGVFHVGLDSSGSPDLLMNDGAGKASAVLDFLPPPVVAKAPAKAAGTTGLNLNGSKGGARLKFTDGSKATIFHAP